MCTPQTSHLFRPHSNAMGTYPQRASCWKHLHKGAVCAIFALVGFCAALPGMAQEDIPVPQAFFPTVKTVVVDILAHLSAENQQTLHDTAFKDLINYHFGFGTYIRNHYGLWQGNKALLENACGTLPCHPDSASMVIIERTWQALQR